MVAPGHADDRSVGRRPTATGSGANAQLVTAPRIYDPGGPVLYLTDVHDPASALAVAPQEATELGCPVIVVDQPSDDRALAHAVHGDGYQRHCDYLDGPVTRRS